ncbi:sigma-70 family RNA polymerase sigma factor [Enterococcus faecalis]|uniref:sigma-70 family RNA polymerase sigma factor n=1 Tax=Enterococcus faecalis TaxID=1351 RepID=UPI001D0B3DB1|nr:sigma-70 family RNA polymerase sigma factor [Enterococcus faecalis]MCB8470878.1 sigma-70 family RNA polymerase sigma factor [Enterococcus faecalis]MCB8499050.1 sigma-70 family RNA polymerase sigma factor [Enterococcus faecalis]MCB8518854.1 sigma-70 family RNA polymerase sigma factor [Enterococcus faecalis]
MKTEMDFTYIFICYVSVTLQRQANAFYKRQGKLFSYESLEFIESKEMEEAIQCQYGNNQLLPDKLIELGYRNEEIYTSLTSLTEVEQYILKEKHVNQRSDASIGKDMQISGQMVSKKKASSICQTEKDTFIVIKERRNKSPP